MSISKLLDWIAAIAATVIFYADFLTGRPASETTPVLTAVVLASLAVRGLIGIPTLRIMPAGDPVRRASTALFTAALFGFLVSAAYGFLTRPSSLPDWGLFSLQVALPVALILTPERGHLILAICKVCVAFATLDMVANLLAVAGLFELPQMSGRRDEFGLSLRYPGLTGNTHAAGLVGFIALVYLVSRLELRRLVSHRNIFIAGWVAALFASLVLVDARRYLVLLAFAIPLLILPQARKIPLPAVIAVIVLVMLGKTFTADYADVGNQLRQDLMILGASRAAEHPLLGQGIMYRSSEGLEATYSSLSSVGATESMILDLSISYGILATLVFLVACVLAVTARRRSLSPPAIFLALLTAELFFGGVLTGVLGSLLFFACLTFCQKESISRPLKAKISAHLAQSTIGETRPTPAR